MKYKDLNVELSKLAVEAKGNKQKQGMLLKKIRPFLLYAMKRNNYNSLSDDYLQESYIATLEAIGTFKEGESFLRWAQYYIRDRLRKFVSLEAGLKKSALLKKSKKRCSENSKQEIRNSISLNKKFSDDQSSGELQDIIPSGYNTEQQLVKNEIMKTAIATIENLSNDSVKMIIKQYLIEEKTISEIAIERGFSEQKIKKIVMEAKFRLKRELEKLGFSPCESNLVHTKEVEINEMEHIKAEIDIYKSKDPLCFFEHNREIKEKILKPLMDSLKKEGYRKTEPIILGNFEGRAVIIDGQHRYEAQQSILRKGIDIEYYYVIEDLNGMTAKQVGQRIIEYNTQKKTWDIADYLKLYCGLQYVDYLKIRRLENEYFSLTFILMLLKISDITNTRDNFRKGLIKYRDEDEMIFETILSAFKRIKQNKDLFWNQSITSPLFLFLRNHIDRFNEVVFVDSVSELNILLEEKEIKSELHRIFDVEWEKIKRNK
ncbi:MAG: sigma-70 family RNA polymerase sigma factor [Mycoplasma sp.]|nr:sigma-70 family RNA polymerase sigma factor [Mycoplasma sp.]